MPRQRQNRPGPAEQPGSNISVIEWGQKPPETVALIPAYAGWPPEFPTPVGGKPKPDPKSLSLMSRQVMRALALHDSAASIADHAARNAVRKAALESAAAGLKRMEKANKLSTELGLLPPFSRNRSRPQEIHRSMKFLHDWISAASPRPFA